MEEHRKQQLAQLDVEGCEAGGGAIEYRGMFGAPMCVTPYPDAGTVCRDSAECVGLCMVLLGGAEVEPEIGGDVEGRCEADDRTFGCYMEVLGGKAQRGICVD
ncbi:hypothetical protein ABI59_10185 [Acidobacteria bacterium Mor1]|nr:hypothetical protein ABI59_10185 [Acidobacteria bacterium Mor1]